MLILKGTQQNVRKDANIVNPITQQPLEIDSWLPNFDLYFEFQDNYHYVTTWRGAWLISVPCWWSGSKESLTASILFERPDLYTHISDIHKDKYDAILPPIPLNPPHEYFKVGEVPGVGELMHASFPSTTTNINISPLQPWWLGEKYDGVRCCWNPVSKLVYARPGTVLQVNEKMLEMLLPVTSFLDGELWFGRHGFSDSQSVVNAPTQVNWAFGRVIAFDNPDPVLHREPFEDRYKTLIRSIAIDHECAMVAMRLSCTSRKHLDYMLQCILSDGGEGVVIRMPKSIYQPGRSSLIWKWKAAKGDDEAMVVTEGDKTLVLQLPNGIQFEVPTSPNYETKRGDIVTFTYDHYSRAGYPVNPVIYRTRSDLSWDDVRQYSVQNSESPDLKKSNPKGGEELSTKSKKNFLEEFARNCGKDPSLPSTWYDLFKKFSQLKEASAIMSPVNGRNYAKTIMEMFPKIGLKASKFPELPYNYWDSISRRRKYFIQFATNNGLDPLIATNWYSLSRDTVLASKHARAILQAYYNLDLSNALLHLFPDIGLDSSRLSMLPGTHWQNKQYHRKLLLDFAKEKGFDALVPESWYSLNTDDVSAKISVLMSYYKNNLKLALTKLFPKMHLDKSKFLFQKRNYWDQVANRRIYFENFAAFKGFDPLVVNNWYNVTAEEILHHKNAASALDFYDKNFVKALQHLFPELQFDETKFKRMPRGFWSDINNRRELLISYAQANNFDPLSPDSWYEANLEELYNFKGMRSVLVYYDGSIRKSLLDAFPDIGLQLRKFSKSDKYWENKDNQRKFFLAYAKQHDFDPKEPQIWYDIPVYDIRHIKGARSILVYYGGSVIKALTSVFPYLDKSKFQQKKANRHWHSIVNQKNLFIDFANARGFDPLLAENWYTVSSNDVTKFKGIKSILEHHNHNWTQALETVFPDVQFDKSKFDAKTPNNYYKDINHQREFFVAFAKEKGFDPLDASQWCRIHPPDVRSLKGARSLLGMYNGSISKALIAAFPSIGLTSNSLKSKTINRVK